MRNTRNAGTEKNTESAKRPLAPKEKKEVKDAAMDYIRFRERSMLEIRKHLKEKAYSPEEIEEAMEFLVDCNLASDRRYCESYLRRGLEKGKGPVRLRRELMEKGVSEELVREGLEEFLDKDQERSRAMEKARKVLGLDGFGTTFGEEEPAPRIEERDLARAARRLASLGYRSEVVYDVIGRLRRETGDGY